MKTIEKFEHALVNVAFKRVVELLNDLGRESIILDMIESNKKHKISFKKIKIESNGIICAESEKDVYNNPVNYKNFVCYWSGADEKDKINKFFICVSEETEKAISELESMKKKMLIFINKAENFGFEYKKELITENNNK